MNGLTWRHIAAIAIGAGVAVGGAWAPAVAATALISLGASLATGALGHAQGTKAEKRSQ